MFDPDSESDVSDLYNSIEWSDDRFRARREQRKEHLKQLVGRHYGDNGADDAVPINMIELGYSIFTFQLSSHAIRGMVSTDTPELTPSATDLELALNQELKRINIANSFNDCVSEALFCMGVMLVGVDSSGASQKERPTVYSQVFADSIPLEDLIVDMNAKSWESMTYVGHRFRVPLDWVKENEEYDPKVREMVSPSTSDGNMFSDSEIDPQTMSRGESGMSEEFIKHADLMQVYLPSENMVLILIDGSTRRPLKSFEWKGPKIGPYRPLRFGRVPSNLIPLAPVPLWYDLHDFINKGANKLLRQSLRQKTILGVAGVAKEDGSRIVDAEDGQAILMDNPNDSREYRFGGPDPQTQAAVMWAKQILENTAGNWPALGGLGAMSRTVGQDKMISESASARIEDMQKSLIEFSSGVLEDIAFWLWQDPLSEYHLLKPLKDTQFAFEKTWTPEQRQGDFFQYNCTVDPYSLVNKSPIEEAAELKQFVIEVLVPLLPIIQQDGMTVNWEHFFKTYDKFNRKLDLRQLITYMQGESIPTKSANEPPGKPANTTRNYVRENRPAGTQQGQDQQMIAHLMGLEKQPAETAMMTR